MRKLLPWKIIDLASFGLLCAEPVIGGEAHCGVEPESCGNQWQGLQNWTPTKFADGNRYSAESGGPRAVSGQLTTGTGSSAALTWRRDQARLPFCSSAAP
jgi:hypothetical protein